MQKKYVTSNPQQLPGIKRKKADEEDNVTKA